MPDIGPAPVLALVVGAFNTCLYVVLRGSIGVRVVLILVAAVLGAFAGQALGSRLGDPVRLGDFSVLWAAALSWVGILIVAVATTLGPSRQGTQGRR